MSESVSWCAHHLQNGDGRVQMGSGLLKMVGSSAHVGGQVLKWKGQPCSLGMAFTSYTTEHRLERVSWIACSRVAVMVLPGW
jgi:hypothetical protein